MYFSIFYQDYTVEIENAEELFVALKLTPSEVYVENELLSPIGEKITDVVTNTDEFLLIFGKVIDTKGASRQPYLQCLGSQLKQVMTNSETLKNTLALLANKNDQEYFFNTMDLIN
ncbi:MAG: hypothetical protein F6K36_23855 [Symploca sp. SIO3C6]|uniref:Uncharacterized protein n=1 Tax=Symploca sp. SIO1C4 TaxID=2607765 RepID=A0A6B3N7P3_9CYAN|nr:hypothetical protein [Symploca sp. SIO3C6]NER29636.1 hypothetical protein [Symploca sp. SIO1C4]